MQVIEKNTLFTEVSVEESAIVSGAASDFIGLATFGVVGLILWGLDQALLYSPGNRQNP
jgi:hypothetical protein